MKRLLWALFLLPGAVWAHGGLPVSESVLRNGETMYIPVEFWGVWVGDGVSPWKWICEEEINPNRTRRFALSTDGAFYTNDTRGVTLSTDHGCTWTAATGELQNLRTTDVFAHPVDGVTAWVTTDDVETSPDGGQTLDNALFVTHDHGATWSRAPNLPNDRRYQSIRSSADGTVLYVTSATSMTPFDETVHRSSDAGQNWVAHPLAFTIGGAAPYSAEVMQVDPRNPDVIYLRAFVTAPDPDGGYQPLQVLLYSSDGGQSFGEVTRVVGEMNLSGATHGIDGVAVDAPRARLYVATKTGLYSADDNADATVPTLAPTGGLSQSQCVEVHGAAVYACSSNYSPDFAALARSDDGAMTFHPVLSYQATEGPVDCPATTPVGSQCPYYWLTYAGNLGINMGFDGGSSGGDGGSNGGGGSCDCSLGGRAIPRLPILLVLLVAGLRGRRPYFLYERGGQP